MTSTNSDTNNTSVGHAEAVVERLIPEFCGSFTRDAIARTVAGSIADLAGVPIADMPELAERVARQRLFTALERHPEWSSFASGEPSPNSRVIVVSAADGMFDRSGVTARHHTASERERP
ncbi:MULTISPECIES: three-helix bundle dimerization domain-containing protein [unclassified Rhodococcus (in: high G+C Gram-positive bacteria)]|uniref:three-helix bundle dimerization domain-containing protein n=1 Tax=unclassified Rhodococcus (in: high G+C Gram-positive bacteria) TaxID=192944 RepID=UPI00077AF44C|nr:MULTISPECIES: hypothetical protein [unclassified Rhodococcus (in: high G+C Gram-positive bacteria)]KXX58850.1 hypothetical protein AZG88_43960 [Rhodococcus sp. LB1]PBC45521.1 hypothetical protein CJ177_45800 [Rhodococcus sp. ACPA1]